MIGRLKKAAAVEPGPHVTAALITRTASVIASERDAAQRELGAREEGLREAAATYEASLDNGRTEALAAREQMQAAEVDRDIARRALARLDGEHAAAVEADRLEAIRMVVAEAGEASEAYEAAVRQMLPEMGRAARVLMRLWATAEIAHERAGTAIKSENTEAFPKPRGVEGFRTWPGRPREVIGETVTRSLWTTSNGTPVADEFQAKIKEQPDGSGRLFGGGLSYFDHRRTFRTETFLAAQDQVAVDPLVSALCVPGITGADNPGWKPLSSPNPRKVLAILDSFELPSFLAVDRRKTETEDVPVGLAVRVTREPEPYSAVRVDPDRA